MIKGFPSTMNDDYQLNLWKIMDYAAKVHYDTEIVSYRNLQGGKIHNLSYKEVYDRIKRISNALESLGIKAGDRIAVLGWNDHRYFESYFSITGLGAVMLQLNQRLHLNDLDYILKHSEAKALLFDESLADIAKPLIKNNKLEFSILMSDDPSKVDVDIKGKLYNYEDLIKSFSPKKNYEEIDEKSAATACYTSGTTGKPKGVYYSHRSLILHGWSINTVMNIKPDDTFAAIVPLFHANGWGAHIAATMMGAKLVFPGRYTPESLANILLKEEVSVAAGAPAILIPLLEVLRKFDPKPKFNNLRFVSGATEPPLALMLQLKEFGINITHAYGATETTPLVTANLPKKKIKLLKEEEQIENARKQGLPVFGVEVKITDPAGNELPWDGKSIGELLIKGPWVAKQYYNDERSKEQFIDNWWKSGDAATIDPNGYVKIVDRIKDLIKSGGEWISSIDLENYLMAHPAVLEASVVGVPHPKWEERPIALVVLREEYKNKDFKELENLLKDHLSKRFAKWQIPDKIFFVNEIPKSSTGKFDKKTIRNLYKDALSK
ncbi:acyl-CoA synthetase (AMP-forming)/AMP-acid ligase II [Caldisphaera lagunensis DSM 15908]|uniref:Acyl-CoA synthetase (AMP-forming)/AMP-acid ligase II n=1 Tax=Caldisphaera lagunensis (strain DSM 15908 / JCM 11604 / ANMR 0165 / IC-154) TaxID=1056495 RepID=L0A7W1_CALLD|nr:long-chain-fatty-acid--CoA ligase [Caldisphaera lagunensis]AFZ69921.1 acyl-CoA synthetase (AMP-forming)/AMP-acid ligase II [Caldisphaera lagunensis DSM 15908]